MPGYVYILSNPSMPGLVKVGSTRKHPEERAKQLSAWTGVPAKFQVECFWYFETAQEAYEYERVFHSQLDERVPGREFFRKSAAKAMLSFPIVFGRPEYISESTQSEIQEMDDAIDRFCLEIEAGVWG